ncbi:hypothetical protein ABFG93_03420 [Pseudalkalibacillus hwajinpoensis]|uniref:hypothetical protein n=1 Tax=Guptibacillus hwajinpoensis TaxID=208199 RepID=UPI00325AB0D4
MMSLFDDNDCGCGKRKTSPTSKCDGCVCDELRKLRPGQLVDLVLNGEDEFTDLTFACFDPKSCCVTFLDEDYPFIVDCRKIQAIRLL